MKIQCQEPVPATIFDYFEEKSWAMLQNIPATQHNASILRLDDGFWQPVLPGKPSVNPRRQSQLAPVALTFVNNACLDETHAEN